MKEKYNKFYKHLEAKDRYNTIKYAKELFNEISIYDLYEIITASLKEIGNKVNHNKLNIYEEHIYTSITSSVIENLYNDIYEKRTKALNKKVIIMCPENEEHNIGARMVTDIFMYLGYNTIYLGSNTPNKEVKKIMEEESPEYIAVSVTNYYNLTNLNDILEELKDKKTKIIVGGSAFIGNEEILKNLKIDHYIKNLKDIEKIGE